MMGDRRTFSRRSVLRAGLGAASAAGLGAAAGVGLGARPVRAAAPRLRGPGAVPYPSLPLGQYTGALPFDHLVLVMQENHSFDNYLGMLPVSGQPRADGFTFNRPASP
jgi:phospholipase C